MTTEVVVAVQRVLVVDDHRVFTDLLMLALDADPGFSCVSPADSVARGREVVAVEDIDVAVIDVQLGDGDGFVLAEEILATRPGVRVVMLTAYPRPDLVRRAVSIGASGLLAKDGSLADLVEGLRSASPARPVLVDLPGPDHDLTVRELEVLSLLAGAADVRAIARTLGISPHTARDHVKSVLAKLGATSQLDAVVEAARRGIVAIGRP